MDEIDKAQLKLEGRCIHCKEKLPNHLTDCELHPRHDVLKGIKNISYHLNNTLAGIAEKAEDVDYRKKLEELLRVRLKK